jgi:hypothetical protein
MHMLSFATEPGAEAVGSGNPVHVIQTLSLATEAGAEAFA